LAYYIEGNVPEALIGTPESWTPQHRDKQRAPQTRAKVAGGVEELTRTTLLSSRSSSIVKRTMPIALVMPPAANLPSFGYSIRAV
jgi:hypothetical protein